VENGKALIRAIEIAMAVSRHPSVKAKVSA
jgi:hypothetical protein